MASNPTQKRKIILLSMAGVLLAVAGIVLLLQRPEVAEETNQEAVEAGDAAIERLKDVSPPPPAPEYTDDAPGNVARPAKP